MGSPYYTRSKAVLEYKAAGVLPFAIQGSQVVVLLGAEKTRTGPKGKYLKFLWRDFGGAREAADADSAATAAREFAEETLGLFQACSVDQHAVEACAAVVAARLRDPLKAMRVVHKLKRGEYHMYLTQTCFISPLMFRLATQQNCATGAVPGGEKSAFAWVPLTDLLGSVYVPRRSYRLTCKSAVCGGRGTPPAANRGLREFPLHPCFANSLRLAQEAGLSDLLSRAEALPLPPAPPILHPPPSAAAATAVALVGAGPAGQQAQHCGPASSAAGRKRGRSDRRAMRLETDSGGLGRPHVLTVEAAALCSDEVDSESSSHSAVHGPTPDHMTYWLSQEAIAVELRGQGQLASGTAAAASAVRGSSSSGAPMLADVCGSYTAALVAVAPTVLLEVEPSASHASCTEAGREHGGLGSADAGLTSEAEGSIAGGGRPDSISAGAAAASQAIAVAVAAAAGQALGGGQGRRKKRTRSRKQRQQLRERRRRQERQEQQQQAGFQLAQQLALLHVEAGNGEPQDADSSMVATLGGMSGSGMLQEARKAGDPKQPEHLIPPPPPPFPPPPAADSHAWEVAQARLSGLLGVHTSPRKRIKID